MKSNYDTLNTKTIIFTLLINVHKLDLTRIKVEQTFDKVFVALEAINTTLKQEWPIVKR